MRITYLIGNGFDIGLGLKTGYKSFIEWYCQQPSQGDEEKWLKKQMKDKPEQWSDAELAFGALEFGSNGKDSLETYERCYDSFTSAFHSYLKDENARFNVKADLQKDIASRFLRSLICIDSFMAEACADDFKKWLEHTPITIQFITFNYTDIIEKILGLKKDESREFEIGRCHGHEMRVSVEGVLHAHGTLNDCYVFGVDDGSQIADEKVRKACERKGEMLKALSAEQIGVCDRRHAMDALRRSELIITYGLSFGETDASWWSVVYDVFRNRNVPIVICPYDLRAPISGRSVRRLNAFYDQEKKRLFATLIRRNQALQNVIESIKVPRIIVLNPEKVGDGYGMLNKCDYLRLKYIGKKCVGKVERRTIK